MAWLGNLPTAAEEAARREQMEPWGEMGGKSIMDWASSAGKIMCICAFTYTLHKVVRQAVQITSRHLLCPRWSHVLTRCNIGRQWHHLVTLVCPRPVLKAFCFRMQTCLGLGKGRGEEGRGNAAKEERKEATQPHYLPFFQAAQLSS